MMTPFQLLLAFLLVSDPMPFALHEASLILSGGSFGDLPGLASVSGDGPLESFFPSRKIGADNP